MLGKWMEISRQHYGRLVITQCLYNSGTTWLYSGFHRTCLSTFTGIKWELTLEVSIQLTLSVRKFAMKSASNNRSCINIIQSPKASAEVDVVVVMLAGDQPVASQCRLPKWLLILYSPSGSYERGGAWGIKYTCGWCLEMLYSKRQAWWQSNHAWHRTHSLRFFV